MKTQDKKATAFSLPFLVLTVLFVVCLIVANLVEIKTVSLGFMTVTAGLAVFPVSYIINDCIVEVYGFRNARFVIWLGFAMSLLVAMMLNIAIWLPGGADWHDQAAMEAVYSSVPRIMFASFAAFICGSMVNAYVMSRMKQSAIASRKDSVVKLSLRAIVSTLWGEGVDSLIFFPIAFAGTLPGSTIINLILTQTLLKTVYEIIILPVTVNVIHRLKRLEHISAN
jgi:hypothetical protein